MYKDHFYTIHKVCPCQIGMESVQQAIDIYNMSNDIVSFVSEMDARRVIGKSIRYDEKENTIYLTKMYACDSGGGCLANKTLMGERCHCDHYNQTIETKPKYYCKCGAEFYRPMFAAIFGEDVLIEPYKTVLSGDDECIIAIRIDKKEDT